jgi:hypothetical protein
MKTIFTLLLSMMLGLGYTQIQSPQEYLVTGYGKQFTPHHLLVDYAYYLAENSPYMTIEEYGRTNEKRPLLLATFTSPENHTNLEMIRRSNLSRAGFTTIPEGVTSDETIIWLSFGVHGNEAGGPESAINVMYQLANPNDEVKGMLENAVVLLDPTVNPDGYSRYTHWHWGNAGKKTHPRLDDREHMEPWPGGRVNHYLFDLNRDWAWQTQVETQQRMVKYNQWLPHIHVDYHEMGHNSHYYFAPAAKPYHAYITDFQRAFQTEIGRNNAAYFDAQSWMYFTRENFDLFYPSYGDTYPTFNGAIGMTYEQAGHSRAGRAVKLNNGDILTLQDRIDHHTATALTTIKTTEANRKEVIMNFEDYFQQAIKKPKGKFKGYVVKKDPGQKSLAGLLDRNKIQYRYSNRESKGEGYNYFTKKNESFTIGKGDLVIDAHQPKSTLLQVLFEPEHLLEDSLTYDITAWSLPFAYGVLAYGMNRVDNISTVAEDTKEYRFDCPEKPYAYYFKWGTTVAHKLIARLLEGDIHLRLSKGAAQFDKQSIGQAYLVAIAGDNRHLENFHEIIQEAMEYAPLEKGCLTTGFSNTSHDLGGGNFNLLKNPRILTISGDRVGTNAFGQIWNYFENHLEYPISIVDIADFRQIDLKSFDVLILPDGYYSLPKNTMADISDWVSNGGKLIAIGGALRNLVDKDGFALAKYATEEEKKEAEKSRADLRLRERLESYEGQERRSIRNSVPGAIIENVTDSTHPLAYGLGEEFYSLKTGSATYNILKDAWNVVYVPEDFESYGFVGSRLKKRLGNTVTYAVEEKGRGKVIYMVDNPLYRGFWHDGINIFTNAVFLVD